MRRKSIDIDIVADSYIDFKKHVTFSLNCRETYSFIHNITYNQMFLKEFKSIFSQREKVEILGILVHIALISK